MVELFMVLLPDIKSTTCKFPLKLLGSSHQLDRQKAVTHSLQVIYNDAVDMTVRRQATAGGPIQCTHTSAEQPSLLLAESCTPESFSMCQCQTCRMSADTQKGIHHVE